MELSDPVTDVKQITPAALTERLIRNGFHAIRTGHIGRKDEFL